MTKYSTTIIFFISMVFAFHSCKHDTPSPGNNPGNPSNPNPVNTIGNSSTEYTRLCQEVEINYQIVKLNK